MFFFLLENLKKKTLSEFLCLRHRTFRVNTLTLSVTAENYKTEIR